MLRHTPLTFAALLLTMASTASAQKNIPAPPTPAPAAATPATTPTTTTAAAAPVPPATAVTVPAPAPAPVALKPPETVGVALRTDADHATIEQRASVQTLGSAPFPFHDVALFGTDTWQPACVAPCTTRLDPRASYRVSGQGLVPSTPFTLPQDRDSVVIDAHMGSAYGRVGGLLLTAGGVGALLLGGAALVATPILEGQNIGTPALRSGVLAGGIGVVGLGIIGLGAGLWLWLHNDTEVRVDPTGVAHATGAPHPSSARFVAALGPSGVAF